MRTPVERLKGKVAFITGAASGQGRAAACLFAAEGALIVGCDIQSQELELTARMVREAGGRMFAMSPVDLGDPDSARRWVDEGIAQAGGIDILYNNAGSVRFGMISNMPTDDWAYTIQNELDLVFYTTRAAWPHLIARSGGVVLNTASAITRLGTPKGGAGAHMAAKGGIIAFTRQIASEGAPHNIRANSISPGPLQSPATAALNNYDAVARTIPLGRWGQPVDVAYCALYLASDEARWVTAADFVIDGGVTGAR